MEAILKSIKKKKIPINPAVVISNKSDAKGLITAKKLGISIEVIESKNFKGSRADYDKKIMDMLSNYGVTPKNGLVCLAGFMRIISPEFVKKYKNRIINIHPALLPKYGGKGMYGMHVHEAVKNNCDKETGITIHFVNERYDEGAIIFQAKTSLKITDSSKDIAQKIHDLEYEYFPKVIEKTILKNGS